VARRNRRRASPRAAAAAKQKPAAGELCLDHLAHFVPDLDAAARLLDALGLSCTPVSHHRIAGRRSGTSNRCVMLERGYLEILCPTLDTPQAQRVRGLMKRYDGVHLACFGTPDAAFERQRLAAHGFEPEPVVDLRRKIDTGEELRFRVVYVAPGKMPEGRVQYCEHLTPRSLWKARYVNPLRLEEIYVVADDPAETAARWARFSGLLPRREGEMVRLDTARGSVLVGRRQVLANFLGAVPPAPAIAGYRLRCRSAGRMAERCARAGAVVKEDGKRFGIALPRALGGNWLLT
jgi:catechol 2,3-dioxygenase-like lactoylglutathione lyase family enzyme